MNITGILLAAGMSRRMPGVNKLTLPFRSGTIAEESLKNLMASPVSRSIVVLGHEEAVISKLLNHYQSESLVLISNHDYREGRASSVRCGVEQLDVDCDAALFMVADKPGVQSKLITRAVEEFRRYRPLVLCVRTPQGRGHPIIFASELFPNLQELQGDQFGRELIEEYRDKIHWLDDDQPQININTQEDYRSLIDADKHMPASSSSGGPRD